MRAHTHTHTYSRIRHSFCPQAGSEETVKNFGPDMKDCSKWVTLLKQICPREAEDAGIDEVMSIRDPIEVRFIRKCANVYWVPRTPRRRFPSFSLDA